MKKSRFYLSMAIVALSWMGCSQEEEAINQMQMSGGKTINATIESITRSTVTDAGVFSWASDDAISVHDETNNDIYNYSGNGNGFTLSGEPQVTTAVVAYYPASASHTSTAFNLPEYYGTADTEYVANTNAAMIATPPAEGSTYAFMHLGGVMRFNVKNVPAGADGFQFTAAGKNITGSFEVEGEDVKTIATSDGINNTVSIWFQASNEARDMTFYVPMPVGTYGNYTVGLRIDTEFKYHESTGVTNTIARKSLLLMPTFTYNASTGKLEKGGVSSDNAIDLRDGSAEAEIIGNAEVEVTPGDPDATATLNYTPASDGSSEISISDGTNSATSAESEGQVVVTTSEDATIASCDINTPSLTVELSAAEGTSVVYNEVTALTAQQTLVIGEGVTIKKLVLKGGNVVLKGNVESIESEVATTITLDKDITLNNSMTFSKGDVTVDLNGNTLIFNASTSTASTKAAANTYNLTNAGTLDIENGKIVSTTEDYAVIYNTGTLTITNTTIETLNRGVLNDGTATLNCNITSSNSNAVCNYNTGTLNITGGIYESKLGNAEIGGVAVRMGDEDSDDAWNLTITGGTFKAPWAALFLANNYYNLDPAGFATISGGIFDGGKADIGGAAIKNVTISSDCQLDVIKNLGTTPAAYSCEMNGYNLQDAENHYDEVMLADVFANGGEYTLTKNITLAETFTVAEGKEVTLNLGEYTLTSTDDYAAFVNKGTFKLTSDTNGKLAASYRGVVNCGTLTLNCNITSQNSNAVCGYGDGTNIITINGGTYTASETIKDASAVRMDPRKGGVNTGSAVDAAWQLTINGGTFVSKNWVALSMLDNYFELEEAGWAKINAGTFTGNSEYADIIGAAVENITINTDACVLTNQTIKNFSDNPSNYSCKMNGYNLQDSNNHYQDVKTAYDNSKK